MTDQDSNVAAVFRRERSRLGNFIRKKKELSVDDFAAGMDDEAADDLRLDLALPSEEAGPEVQAAYDELEN